MHSKLIFRQVVGDVLSIHGMAEVFEEVYGNTPILECQGTLEDLRTRMLTEREKYGADVYKYIFQ